MDRNHIVFTALGYWDKTMKTDQQPTDEQMQKVKDICKRLNQKYYTDIPCPLHPDTFHKLSVYLHNGLLSIEFAPSDTCRCKAAMLKLAELKEYEMASYNQGH